MQITLDQPEIELALREYVSNILTIREGSQMNIEFTSTRNPPGLNAKIDITNSLKASVIPAAKVVEAPVAALAHPAPALHVVQDETKAETKAEEAPFDTSAQGAEGASQGEQATSGDPEQSEGTEQQAAAGAGRSLFKNFAKPRNG